MSMALKKRERHRVAVWLMPQMVRMKTTDHCGMEFTYKDLERKSNKLVIRHVLYEVVRLRFPCTRRREEVAPLSATENQHGDIIHIQMRQRALCACAIYDNSGNCAETCDRINYTPKCPGSIVHNHQMTTLAMGTLV